MRENCPGSFHSAKPDLPSYATVGECPDCEMRLAVDRQGRMRQHKAPSPKQLARRAEYLAYKAQSAKPHQEQIKESGHSQRIA